MYKQLSENTDIIEHWVRDASKMADEMYGLSESICFSDDDLKVEAKKTAYVSAMGAALMYIALTLESIGYNTDKALDLYKAKIGLYRSQKTVPEIDDKEGM